MIAIAGGMILGGIGLYALFVLFSLLTMKGRPRLLRGLGAGWKGFMEGMRAPKK